MPTILSLPTAETVSPEDYFPISQLNEDGSTTLRKAQTSQVISSNAVQSVAGRIGAITLTHTDIGGFDGSGFHRNITVTSLVSAGTGQSTATALTGQVNEAVTSTNTGGAGFVLPTGIVGLWITFINADTTNAANVYPATGAKVNALGTNAAFSVPAASSVTFRAISATAWFT
jgi:hypothetical protein